MGGGYKISNQQGIYFLTFSVVEWVDVFTRNDYCQIVIDSLNYCIRDKGMVLHCWCLMSNHVHLIASASEGHQISDILIAFKKYTSTQILKAIEDNNFESRKNWILWIFKSAGEQNKRNEKYQFWQQDNHPIELETNHFKLEKMNYIHMNPVRAGIVRNPEDYLYSSATDYSGGKGLTEISFL